MSRKRIVFIAGEHSGDLQGSLVLSHLKKLSPEILTEGIGGPLMQKAGLECIHSIDELAVIGFVEVLSNLRHLLGIYSDTCRWLRETRPDMLVLIDYPGFNVRVAKAARALGIHVVYYITPQVWAWRSSRVRKIASVINEAVVVFPFEVEIWKREGIPVEWFGHPLIGTAESRVPPETFRADHGLGDGQLVALLPGSRNQEIYYILPPLLKAAERIFQRQPNIRFLLPVAGTIGDAVLQPYLANCTLPITVLRGQTYDAVAASDLAMVASGTATLETAILGTPMLIVYQTNWLTSLISKYLIQVPHIGLPNVVAGREVVPEFIRWNFNPEMIAHEALAILESPERQTRIRSDLAELRKRLGAPGASSRVAEHLLRRLGEVAKR
ncbi:MAG TPA: lipid-A-disaccharide synthase [Candidatus Ozemobacteraceae bacterium]|nr:lipid-A-disaccharide synthase [Candidatus Ozemobacteraceae bacterium]